MCRSSMRAIRAGLVLAAFWGVLGLAQNSAQAKCSKYREVDIVGSKKAKKKKVPRVGKPERVFGGKVLTSKKRFPTWARSVNTLIAKIRKQTQKKFWENKEKKEWKVFFMAFFKHPLDDLEVSIKLYDVTTPPKRMVSSFEQYIDRCATSYASSMVLKREDFGVNKQILITVGSAGRPVLASGKFKILGEAERYSGKAVFTDEETQERQEEDTEGAADAFDTPGPEPTPEEPMRDPLALTDDPDKELTEADLEEGPEREDLDAEDTEMPKLPAEQRKADRGCGCRAGGGSAAGGLLIVLAAWLGAFRRRAKGPRR